MRPESSDRFSDPSKSFAKFRASAKTALHRLPGRLRQRTGTSMGREGNWLCLAKTMGRHSSKPQATVPDALTRYPLCRHRSRWRPPCDSTMHAYDSPVRKSHHVDPVETANAVVDELSTRP